jgi:hypothetical protein
MSYFKFFKYNRQVSWLMRRSIDAMRQIAILGVHITISFVVSKECTIISFSFIFVRGFFWYNRCYLAIARLLTVM